MDLLKAEIERKRRAIVAATSTSANSINNDDSNNSNNKKRRYLTVAERRRIEEEEEAAREEEDELRRNDNKEKTKRRKRLVSDEDGEKEEEDLTTLLTKKYDPSQRKMKSVELTSSALSATATSSSSSAGEKSNASQIVAAGGGEINNADNTHPGDSIDDNDNISISLKRLTPAEITNTLRRFGLPVRLFGELDDKVRLQRLSIAMQGREAAMLGESERDEFLLDSANRTRNVFLEKDNHNDDDTKHHGGGGKAVSSSTSSSAAAAAAVSVSTTPLKTQDDDINDAPKRIYRYFKSLLRQWEDDLAQRTESVRKSAAGKNETKTLKQCKDYIRPLFQMCKRREVEEGLQAHLIKIVNFCEMGEFVKAHDSYMDVAIGRAAWPIGVTMVGIHARSGRAKIESSNVAHVMNSELNRKFLTSVKRLMSYAQRKRPDVDPSKKVVNV